MTNNTYPKSFDLFRGEYLFTFLVLTICAFCTYRDIKYQPIKQGVVTAKQTLIPQSWIKIEEVYDILDIRVALDTRKVAIKYFQPKTWLIVINDENKCAVIYVTKDTYDQIKIGDAYHFQYKYDSFGRPTQKTWLANKELSLYQ